MTLSVSEHMKKDLPLLRIGLHGVESEGGEWSGEIPSTDEFWSTPELDLREQATLAVRLSPTADGGLHVTGTLGLSPRLSCRRCLRELSPKIEIPLDLWFDPAVPAGEQDGPAYRIETDAAELDLTVPLREAMLLAVPEYPVCSEGCRGLCPRCGVNWNDGPCDCGGEEPDPRWERLRQLTAEEQD